MAHRKKILSVLCVLSSALAYGSGFGLYQPSAVSHAMGGALVGRAMDASANFNNPATLTDLTNLQVTVGFVTEHPRGHVKVNGVREEMDPGAFLLPHLMLSVPLPWDFTFGLGISPEYGLGSEYSKDWSMNWNTVKTTVQSIVLNPNLAYKILDNWSVGAGLRWLYFDFAQDSMPMVGQYGHFTDHLSGDNEWKDFGWQIGTKYDILDNLSAGLVYKSQINNIAVKGRSSTYEPVGYLPAVVSYGMLPARGGASANLDLPQSLTGGLNWDATRQLHLGTAVSWTQWSAVDTLVFHVGDTESPKELGWHDTCRASLGAAYDFFEDWTFMISYVYDMDCTYRHQSSAMLPPADRHILGGGLTWRCWAGLELTISYACIFMDGKRMSTSDSLGREYELTTSEGFCHAAGCSITYRF